MSIVLTDIRVYPVKSLRGFVRQSARAENIGLAGDRRWLIVDAEGRFISQRSHPQLACLDISEDGADLLIQTPAQPPLRLSPPAGSERLTVGIWRDEVDAAAAGTVADRWFSAYLGRPCRVVWLDDTRARPLRKEGLPAGAAVSFADGYPCLLASETSLADLNDRMATPLPMDRFRPNLVVAGAEPFAEDDWSRMRVGTALLRVAGPCARCSIPSVNQTTGIGGGPEPLATLSRFRQTPAGVMFGVNLIVEEPGSVAVGDVVQLLP